MASTHCRRVALATLFIGLDTLTTVFAMRTARYLTRVPHRPRRASNVKGRSGESRRLVICRQREAKFTATALAAARARRRSASRAAAGTVARLRSLRHPLYVLARAGCR